MPDVDDWLAHAAQVTQATGSAPQFGRVERSMHLLPSPAVAAVRHDAKLFVVCGVLSALCTFWVTDKVALRSPSVPSATWIAMPPAASPFGLLVGI